MSKTINIIITILGILSGVGLFLSGAKVLGVGLLAISIFSLFLEIIDFRGENEKE